MAYKKHAREGHQKSAQKGQEYSSNEYSEIHKDTAYRLAEEFKDSVKDSVPLAYVKDSVPLATKTLFSLLSYRPNNLRQK